MKVTVIGSGSWGTALANVLADNEHEVLLWGREEDVIEEINEKHRNERYLPGAAMNQQVKATTDLPGAVAEAEALVLVVPTKAIRSVCEQIRPLLASLDEAPVIIHAAKGIEQNTRLRVSEVIDEVLGSQLSQPIAVLSGPSHAEEVIDRQITTISVASQSKEVSERVQKLFMNHYFRVYTNQDVLGVELGGALKNIIALASGMLVALGYGDNAKAALMTRGLAEITRLGVAMGADPLTFSGLSGLGDLIVTCTSEHSRNWQAGYLIAQGKGSDKVQGELGMVVEGISTCEVAHELSEELGVEMPITSTIYAFLHKQLTPEEAVEGLMMRRGRQEASMADASDLQA